MVGSVCREVLFGRIEGIRIAIISSPVKQKKEKWDGKVINDKYVEH